MVVADSLHPEGLSQCDPTDDSQTRDHEWDALHIVNRQIVGN